MVATVFFMAKVTLRPLRAGAGEICLIRAVQEGLRGLRRLLSPLAVEHFHLLRSVSFTGYGAWRNGFLDEGDLSGRQLDG